MISCGKNESNDALFSPYNSVVFEKVLLTKERDEITIDSVDAYYYESWYFYRVAYSFMDGQNEWIEVDAVYLGENAPNWFINLNWEESNWEHEMFAQRRDRYYEAIENAEEHKSFTQTEIARYIDEYYAAKEASAEG